MTREPVEFATYPGDITAAIARDHDNGRPFGPSYIGEAWFPVTAEYNPVTNKTRVGFSLIPPENWGIS